MSASPYDYICEPIEKWCQENYYTDFLVTIWVGDHETTQYLGLEDNASGFVWEYDWWEGEQDVRLLGFFPVNEIKLHNYPVESNSFRIRHGTDEELAKYINEISNGDCPPVGDCPDGFRENETCTPWQCWLSWLKAPVEPGEVSE